MERRAGTPIALTLLAATLAFIPGNAGAQPYDPPPSNFTAYWEVPGFKDHPYLGPEKAKGAVLWSHGVSGQQVQYTAPPPDVLRDFARAGWDIIKIQRNNTHEQGWSASGTKHVSYVVERARKARADGYRRVIAAGQSYGGAISLEASARGDDLFGVIAFAPGHGSDACGTQAGFSARRISDNIQRQLIDSIHAAKAPRIVVLMADGDECQGFNEPSRIIRDALERIPGKYLQFDATMPVRGHGAASTGQFRAWYGSCLLEFLNPDKEPAAKQTNCPHPTSSRFLFEAGYKFPVAPATAASAQAKLIGAWGGTYASETSTVDRDRDICIAVESANAQQITALAAFGAGPERKSSMLNAKRTFASEGDSFVYKGSNNYRMALQPAGDDSLRVAITSADGTRRWSGTLKRGC
jgi:pimeloyl-ACP methyl ester carboxylesterase